jgi:hypothetical protein
MQGALKGPCIIIFSRRGKDTPCTFCQRFFSSFYLLHNKIRQKPVESCKKPQCPENPIPLRKNFTGNPSQTVV